MSDKKVISIDSELYIVESNDSTERSTAELAIPDPKSPSVFAEQLKKGKPLNNNTKKAPHES